MSLAQQYSSANFFSFEAQKMVYKESSKSLLA